MLKSAMKYREIELGKPLEDAKVRLAIKSAEQHCFGISYARGDDRDQRADDHGQPNRRAREEPGCDDRSE